MQTKQLRSFREAPKMRVQKSNKLVDESFHPMGKWWETNLTTLNVYHFKNWTLLYSNFTVNWMKETEKNMNLLPWQPYKLLKTLWVFHFWNFKESTGCAWSKSFCITCKGMAKIPIKYAALQKENAMWECGQPRDKTPTFVLNAL